MLEPALPAIEALHEALYTSVSDSERMELPELRMCFADCGSLARELEQNLRHGRAFLPVQHDVEVLGECVLVLVHPDHGAEFRLPAQVVMVNPSGTGIALRPLSGDELAKLIAFAEPGADPPPSAAKTLPPPTLDAQLSDAADTVPDLLADSVEAPASVLEGAPEEAAPAEPIENECAMPTYVPEAPSEVAVEDERPTVIPSGGEEELAAEAAADGGEGEVEAEAAPELASEDDPDAQPLDHEEELAYPDSSAAPNQDRAPSVDLQAGASRQERLRHLNVAQQLKIARTGELADRVAVERLYGKQVWEALLHNPRLSIPEVARIARKGTVPKPLLDVILENAAWIKADAVRRALLSNPKIGAEAIQKLLRATPRHELKMIEKGTAYAAGVRESARKLLRQ